LFSALPITFVDMVLDQAYQAHDRALSDLHDRLEASNSTCQRQAADHSASHVSRCASRMDWMTTQVWFDFSTSWCESVQALVGNVKMSKNSVAFLVDVRAWEPLGGMGDASEVYRHYAFGTNRHFPLRNRRVSQTEMELFAKVRLSDICTEASKVDYYQRVWQCFILTTVEIGGKVLRRLERESLLVEADFDEDDTQEVSSQLTNTRHSNGGAHPRAHPSQLLARVSLKTPCAPTCPAGRPIDLKAFLSGLAPGVEYAVVYHVQQGIAVMHSSSEQVMRPRVSGDEPAESYAVESGARLPPLEPGLYSVRISVHDAFPGLSREESLLTKMVVNVGVGGEGESPGGISGGGDTLEAERYGHKPDKE